MNYQDLIEAFPTLNFKLDEPLANYSYTQTGGRADVIILPKDVQEIQAVLAWIKDHDPTVDVHVLGNLSNVIVRDGGMEGIVFILSDMNQISCQGTEIYAEAGASLIDVTHLALGEELTGLEFACGIPGSVGGAVFMNAGAYGGEVCEVIVEVEAITQEGQPISYSNEECDFAYRHSVFQDNGAIILGARFRLNEGDPQAIKNEMDRVTELRQSKQPLEYPSCGSVFKRPQGHYTGQLIQQAGLQGHQIGGAQVSTKHAGFIVNIDHATAQDYTDMIAHIQSVIWEKFQVRLEPEVRIIGHDQI
ncbi:UDP-N-acetylmuramate dehydrogenase [Hutsoniella sourekii]|uniref:UDP-N-acetylmuramate dehydrogenase n=1 Tax=Hutsoniella sourekii TaxID=87650 RepID=UPI0004800F47|nr:UDP-N-acetylmuramate dehydrogenase [Hutsoniella sourekii]